MQEDIERLDRVLKDIHEHGGAISLWHDLTWLQQVQLQKPSWALPVFQKYASVPHVHNETLKKSGR